jgi:FtsP/CotA-like multicopper oxidase with cupredoxin domain
MGAEFRQALSARGPSRLRMRPTVETDAARPARSRSLAIFLFPHPGRWAFHCHHLYHMAAEMMAFVAYNA